MQVAERLQYRHRELVRGLERRGYAEAPAADPLYVEPVVRFAPLRRAVCAAIGHRATGQPSRWCERCKLLLEW